MALYIVDLGRADFCTVFKVQVMHGFVYTMASQCFVPFMPFLTLIILVFLAFGVFFDWY